MRYRITRDGYALDVDGVVHVGGEFAADLDSLPEWSALHGALARGDVEPVTDDPASTTVSEPAAEQDAGTALGDMTRAELWRMARGRGLTDGLSYRTATADDLIAVLGADDGE